jgi:hypothetical protein
MSVLKVCRALLFVVAGLLAGCCQSFTETGTGFWAPCETCPGVPINLVCSKNAELAAVQDATTKARAKCKAPNKLQVLDYKLDGPAQCVRRGGNWGVEVSITQNFKCCEP